MTSLRNLRDHLYTASLRHTSGRTTAGCISEGMLPLIIMATPTLTRRELIIILEELQTMDSALTLLRLRWTTSHSSQARMISLLSGRNRQLARLVNRQARTLARLRNNVIASWSHAATAPGVHLHSTIPCSPIRTGRTPIRSNHFAGSMNDAQPPTESTFTSWFDSAEHADGQPWRTTSNT